MWLWGNDLREKLNAKSVRYSPSSGCGCAYMGASRTPGRKNSSTEEEAQTMTLMIFVLVLLTPGGVPTGTELYFQELTSCLEYRDALVHQSVHTHNWLRSKTNKFDGFCEVRLIPSSEAGKGKYIFRDPVRKKEDE